MDYPSRPHKDGDSDDQLPTANKSKVTAVLNEYGDPATFASIGSGGVGVDWLGGWEWGAGGGGGFGSAEVVGEVGGGVSEVGGTQCGAGRG